MVTSTPSPRAESAEAATPAPPRPKTCDNCRKRKIKCVEDEKDASNPCIGCRNIQIDCTYDYVKKKPGRKNSFALAIKSAQAQTQPELSPRGAIRQSHLRQTYSPYPEHRTPQALRYAGHITPAINLTSGTPTALGFEPAAGTVAAATPTPRSPFSTFSHTPGAARGNGNGGLSWLDSISLLDGTSMLGAGLDFGFDMAPGATQFPSEQAQLLSLESPENLLGTSTSGVSLAALQAAAARKEPRLEDVTSWANISHYISLYLQYLYPILPLVHRPTFAENLATRLDLRDTDFRALLLSIVAFTISQLPTSRLTTEQFDVDGLKQLQRRCHRTSQILQRTYHGQVSLTQICIIIFDNFYLLSIGLAHTAASRLGQAVQLAFSLGLHNDAKTRVLGFDAVEIQLGRRVFWQLYASDKTRAINGNPMLINDFQGVCSYPDAVDDDFITSQGMFPQPPSRTSSLAGFVAVSKLFRILSECFFHHRCIISELPTIAVEWTTNAEERVHNLLRDLPAAIQDPTTVSFEAQRQVFATQRANILITVAIVKFALYDLRSALNVDDEQLGREREAIAREIHNLLMSIPVEDVAANGESVRGKVFHIACALCNQASTPGTDTDLVRDWCDMFSAITFLQMPPPPPGAVLDSRSNSPPPDQNHNPGTG